MQIINRQAEDFLYQQVIELIHKNRKEGAIRPGDKLPSLRKLSQQLNISVPTVKQAYIELERQGIVSARPQSGYYLKPASLRPLKPLAKRRQSNSPVELECRDVIQTVHNAIHTPGVVPLGISNPVMAHPPDKTLARAMRRVLTRMADKTVSYGPIDGDPKLRQQIATRYQEMGVDTQGQDVLITNGTQEALTIALQCVAKAGDTIAVESPTFFGILELIETLGMKALEICTCVDEGVCLEELQDALNKHNIKACMFSTAINNPLGSFMPDDKRQKLVAMLEEADVPLIEDDVYGDLYFTEQRGKPARFFAKTDNIISCSSFSKTAAPGYRIGWLLAGKWQAQAHRIKRAMSCSTNMITQWTMSDYMATGEYDRHITQLRKILLRNRDRMLALVTDHFPDKCRVSQPKGGSVLWIKCPASVNTFELLDIAMQHNIAFTPGRIFDASGKYDQFMRLSFGVPWSEELENGVIRLGHLVAQCCDKT
ncbi:MAG: PLP-dependent aminotransferase family protein [Aestuariibacter sp.]